MQDLYFDPLRYFRKNGTEYDPHRRERKRHERKASAWTQLENAYYLGCHDYLTRKPHRNPYPAGKRHDSYNQGYGPCKA